MNIRGLLIQIREKIRSFDLANEFADEPGRIHTFFSLNLFWTSGLYLKKREDLNFINQSTKKALKTIVVVQRLFRKNR